MKLAAIAASLVLFSACRSPGRARPATAAALDAAGVVETKTDLDGDGKADMIAVVPQRAPGSEGLELDAFGYGPAPSDSRTPCLKVGLTSSPALSRVLCGRSPVLALQPDSAAGQISTVGRRVRHEERFSELPPHIARAAVGDVYCLQTQATDLAVYFTANGLRWEELSGGE